MNISNIFNSLRNCCTCLRTSSDSKDDFKVKWSASNPGFTDEFCKVMYDKLQENLNVEGSGAVVAAPDTDTPGGSYYYHWMRDAGLTMKSWMDIHDNDYEAIKDVLTAYVGWVKKVQNQFDPNKIDVRVEPKFEIPSGDPYLGEWGRPQTDGPALRSMALSQWGSILINNDQIDETRCKVWPLIKFDLEWVMQNWKSSGFDLWEEVQSNDFYFNQMSYVYSLNLAADLAEKLHVDKNVVHGYREKAGVIRKSAKLHWNGKFIYQSTNRPIDGSIILSVVTFGSHLFGPNTNEAVDTIRVLCNTFYSEYQINQTMNEKGIPGILIGRYPGDIYAGGNPWQLLTAILAECFYLAAEGTLKDVKGDSNKVNCKHNGWINFLSAKDEKGNKN